MLEKVQKKKTSRWEFRLLGFCPFGLLFALCVTLSLLGEQLPGKGVKEKVSIWTKRHTEQVSHLQ